MARNRASMREGPLAELFKETEAAQRAQEEGQEGPARPRPPPRVADRAVATRAGRARRDRRARRLVEERLRRRSDATSSGAGDRAAPRPSATRPRPATSRRSSSPPRASTGCRRPKALPTWRRFASSASAAPGSTPSTGWSTRGSRRSTSSPSTRTSQALAVSDAPVKIHIGGERHARPRFGGRPRGAVVDAGPGG